MVTLVQALCELARPVYALCELARPVYLLHTQWRPGGWLGRRRKQFETRLHKCTETRDVLPNPTCCVRTTLESPRACVELRTACSGVRSVFLSF